MNFLAHICLKNAHSPHLLEIMEKLVLGVVGALNASWLTFIRLAAGAMYRWRAVLYVQARL